MSSHKKNYTATKKKFCRLWTDHKFTSFTFWFIFFYDYQQISDKFRTNFGNFSHVGWFSNSIFLFKQNHYSVIIVFQMQIGLPITGKYRDPESDQYYNNNNVRIPRNLIPLNIRRISCFFGYCVFLIVKWRELKFYKHHISTMNTYWATKLRSSVWLKECRDHILHG